MTEQNQTTITYITEGVDVANDLIIKALECKDWDVFCEYSLELLKSAFEYKDILKLQDDINKFRHDRDKIASRLRRTSISDSRQIPLNIERHPRTVPDMSGNGSRETLMQEVRNRAQRMGFDLTQKVGREVSVTAE
jgi:hypothetical protein